MPPPPKDEGSGLFSKVVKFVKNPATSWGGLDSQDSDRESSYSKQMLKEMIERKRRNDFVRKREFDMLRKMRRSEAMAGQDPGGRPSFFQSSMPSRPDDRANTLKKIDEIEAQMSMQWWKTKHGDISSKAANSTGQAPLSSQVPLDAAGRPPGNNAYSRTAPQDLDSNPSGASSGPDAEPMLEFVPPTGAAPLSGRDGTRQAPLQPEPVAPRLQEPEEPASAPAVARAGPPSEPSTGFSASKQLAIQVEEFAHDPELEEAAIRFANGDDAGAEAGLLEVLGPQGSRLNHDETWLALFDLYRAIGEQPKFEAAAIDFAGRFGRSAPQWFSIPDAVGRMSAGPEAPATGNQAANWNCPATLGAQSIVAMNATLGRLQPPWRLSWAKLTTIEEAALEPLTKLFTQWASQPVQLRFLGADNLENVLKAATPSGDKDVNPAWWKLRMEVLRVMHRPDEFELVALDYCVTYEVSPPSWESARCDYKALQADGSAVSSHSIIGEPFRDSMSSVMTMGYGDTGFGGHSQQSNFCTVELAGQVLGDAKEAVQLLDDKVQGADFVVISCANLIRIDFTAAGTLLNWVTARQAEGRHLQFVEVHRLVAALFNVIGISEHARVLARAD